MKDLKLIYRATSKEDAEIEGTMPIEFNTFSIAYIFEVKLDKALNI